MSRFYLGIHEPSWLRRTSERLFVSRRRLARLKRTLPEAQGPWALDSGGFTELQMYGRWTVSAAAYAEECARYAAEVGRMEWASPQDWMCEPIVIRGGDAGAIRFAGTGLSVEEHQRRTVANYLELRDLAPELPWAPVLQGWERDDYLRCVEAYERAGVDLTRAPLVGVGSVCRRQSGKQVAEILFTLAALGLRLHGFGLKLKGLQLSADVLASADSMAWSSHARRRPALPGCTHKSCANCLRYATRWRKRVESIIARAPRSLFYAGAAA